MLQGLYIEIAPLIHVCADLCDMSLQFFLFFSVMWCHVFQSCIKNNV